ncbi:MAG: alkaline phosphatase family protein [Gemmatimonadaceae bacterium]|nr:alkaline phosphatase family protein [Chitinophagaceae bacterium]
MQYKIFVVIAFSFATLHITAQKRSENIVVVTLDGMRWQDVFTGADSLLTYDTMATYSEKYVQENFWAASGAERRKKLMPFIWSEISAKGIILGNRAYGNYINTANPHWFSYPGYNEIITGFPDTTVNSNDKNLNKNENVFELMNRLPAFKGKTAVFGSWDLFSYMFNEKRSGVYVNDGFKKVEGKLSKRQSMLNELQSEMPDLFHGAERLDVATFYLGLDYMKLNKPRLMYFGLGDTDEFAHAGDYDSYLDAARKADKWISQLWQYIQSEPFYANKTTLLITTDHGRGQASGANWRHHGKGTPGSGEIWFAAIGPSVPASGEVKTKAQNFQGQIAATIAAMLGQSFNPTHKPMAPLSFRPGAASGEIPNR